MDEVSSKNLHELEGGERGIVRFFLNLNKSIGLVKKSRGDVPEHCGTTKAENERYLLSVGRFVLPKTRPVAADHEVTFPGVSHHQPVGLYQI